MSGGRDGLRDTAGGSSQRRTSREPAGRGNTADISPSQPMLSSNGAGVRRGSKDSAGDRRRSKNSMSRSPRPDERRLDRRPSKESAGMQRRGSKDSSQSKSRGDEKKQTNGQRKLRHKNTPKHWNDARFKDKAFLDALFKKFDPERDGTGSLDCRLMYELLRSVDMELDMKEVEQLVRQIDLDGNGTVELDEFHFFFSKAKDRAELKSMTKKLMKTDEKAFVKELFKNFDSGGQGSMNKDDLYEMTEFLNMDLSKQEVGVLVNTIDLDGNGTIEIDELLFFFDKVKSRNELVGMMKNMTSNNREFLRKVFEMFDPENTGSLTETQLYDVTKFMKLNFSRKAVKGLLAKMDEDGNGTVELDEFFAFFDQVKDIKDMKNQCDRNRKSQEFANNVQRSMMLAGLAAGIAFVVVGVNSAEGEGTVYTFLGVICLVVGGLFAMAQFGTKLGGPIVANVFCKCNKKRLMWGGLFFVIFLVLLVVEVINSAGPETEEKPASMMPMAIVFACCCAVFCLCGFAGNFQQGLGYSEQVAPDTDPTSPTSSRTPTIKRLGSFGQPRTAGKGSTINEPEKYNSERGTKQKSKGDQKKKGIGFADEP